MKRMRNENDRSWFEKSNSEPLNTLSKKSSQWLFYHPICPIFFRGCYKCLSRWCYRWYCYHTMFSKRNAQKQPNGWPDGALIIEIIFEVSCRRKAWAFQSRAFCPRRFLCISLGWTAVSTVSQAIASQRVDDTDGGVTWATGGDNEVEMVHDAIEFNPTRWCTLWCNDNNTFHGRCGVDGRVCHSLYPLCNNERRCRREPWN